LTSKAPKKAAAAVEPQQPKGPAMNAMTAVLLAADP
jgi:hypothetical protein